MASKEIEIDYKRQVNLFNPRRYDMRVAVVGLGNIGSATALMLGRLGITELMVCDFDKVEVHNLTSQQYDVDDIGESKVSAIIKKLQAINPAVNVLGRDMRFRPGFVSGDILIVAIDSMEGRKEICAAIKKIPKADQPKLIIDGRVGGDQLEVYNCKSAQAWNKTFVDNPAQDPCGGRFICYVSSIIGGIITNQVKRFIKGDKLEKSIMMNVDTLQIVKNFEW